MKTLIKHAFLLGTLAIATSASAVEAGKSKKPETKTMTPSECQTAQERLNTCTENLETANKAKSKYVKDLTNCMKSAKTEGLSEELTKQLTALHESVKTHGGNQTLTDSVLPQLQALQSALAKQSGNNTLSQSLETKFTQIIQAVQAQGNSTQVSESLKTQFEGLHTALKGIKPNCDQPVKAYVDTLGQKTEMIELFNTLLGQFASIKYSKEAYDAEQELIGMQEATSGKKTTDNNTKKISGGVEEAIENICSNVAKLALTHSEISEINDTKINVLEKMVIAFIQRATDLGKADELKTLIQTHLSN